MSRPSRLLGMSKHSVSRVFAFLKVLWVPRVFAVLGVSTSAPLPAITKVSAVSAVSLSALFSLYSGPSGRSGNRRPNVPTPHFDGIRGGPPIQPRCGHNRAAKASAVSNVSRASRESTLTRVARVSKMQKALRVSKGLALSCQDQTPLRSLQRLQSVVAV